MAVPLNILEKQLSKFNELKLAQSYVNRMTKPGMVIMGDDGKYWVGTPSMVEPFVKQGYEVPHSGGGSDFLD